MTSLGEEGAGDRKAGRHPRNADGGRVWGAGQRGVRCSRTVVVPSRGAERKPTLTSLGHVILDAQRRRGFEGKDRPLSGRREGGACA